VLVEPEQHVAADEPPPPLAPQPGKLSERDYTVVAQPGENPEPAVSAVADPDPEGSGPSGAPLEMAIYAPTCANSYGYLDYGLCGLCDYKPSQEDQIHAELDARDAAAERARAAARPALDLAAEANAPAVRRPLPPGYVPKGRCFICAKEKCYVAVCTAKCSTCGEKLCPGAFSSKTCVVYAATEPIAANITNAQGRVVSVRSFSYLLDKWTARQAHRPRAHDQAATNKSEQHAAADKPERRFATVAAAEPDGVPDEPEQRVAIAAAVPAKPGSAPVEPELHAAANEPPPPWTALTVPYSRSRTRRRSCRQPRQHGRLGIPRCACAKRACAARLLQCAGRGGRATAHPGRE